jgi:hypothetical protein
VLVLVRHEHIPAVRDQILAHLRMSLMH